MATPETASREPDIRQVFQEELGPLQREVGEVRTSTGDLTARLDKLETDIRAMPSMRAEERKPQWSEQDILLAGALFNNDGHEQIRSGAVGRGVNAMTRAFNQALIAQNGSLNPEQSDTFLTHTFNQNDFLRLLNYEPMSTPEKELDKLDVASRILRKKESLQEPVEADPEIGTPVRLNAEELGVKTRISFESFEENIMRGRVAPFILNLFGIAFGNDLADLAVNGVGSGADAFLALNKGYLQLLREDATVHDVDGATVAGDVKGKLFPALRDAMPVKFRRLNPAYIVSHRIADAYIDQLTTRPTDLGDVLLENGKRAPTFQGYPVIAEDHMPDGAAIFTPLSNLVIGMLRNITFGVDVFNVARYAAYGWTARVDFAIKHGPAAVLCENVTLS